MIGHKIRTWLGWGLAAAALAGLLWAALRPSPVKVEVGELTRGPLEVFVAEQGETRAHDRYVVSAPVAGRVIRIQWREGDHIRAGQAVATLQPLPLDPRERIAAEERLHAAEAVQRQSEAVAAQARTAYEQARRDLNRAEGLAKDGIIARQALEYAQNTEAAAEKNLVAAKSRIEAAESDVKSARATVESQLTATSRPVLVHSPVSGRVMRVPDPSERVVQAGAALLTLGDTRNIEIVVDVLSTDAVNIHAGAEARLVNWGGPNALKARVRLVEPAGFTKVSALGVEEQRVNVVLDFVDPPGALSDGYRVETEIVTWRAADVVKAPASALFRCGSQWCLFAVQAGMARKLEVQTGQKSAQEVEILGGAAPGIRVVLHPPNTLAENTRVEPIASRRQ